MLNTTFWKGLQNSKFLDDRSTPNFTSSLKQVEIRLLSANIPQQFFPTGRYIVGYMEATVCRAENDLQLGWRKCHGSFVGCGRDNCCVRSQVLIVKIDRQLAQQVTTWVQIHYHTLTPKIESMFCSVSLLTPDFENGYTKFDTNVVASGVS